MWQKYGAETFFEHIFYNALKIKKKNSKKAGCFHAVFCEMWQK